MSSLAPLLQRFFSQRLVQQRRVSDHTVAAYRDAFRLLLKFAEERIHKAPSDLQLSDVDAKLVAAFLTHLEKDRGNTARTRNARLAAIHSFFRFIAYEEPAHSELIQRVLAIPSKGCEKKLVSFLDNKEVEAVLAAPDLTNPLGRRDHALMLVAIQTGLRVSELTGLRWQDVHLDSAPHVRCEGKGRKERCTPLTREIVAELRTFKRELQPLPSAPVFAGRSGGALSRDAVERLVAKHIATASTVCASLKHKKISPHSLRHTSAMRLISAGVERTVIALWLGHESIETTEIYIHADMSIKERAIQRAATLPSSHRRYRPSDRLMAFLEAL